MSNFTKQLVVALGVTNTGFAGTLGYTVLAHDGTSLIARTTAGVTESGASGIYYASNTFSTEWSGRIIWDNGGDALAAEAFDPAGGSNPPLITRNADAGCTTTSIIHDGAALSAGVVGMFCQFITVNSAGVPVRAMGVPSKISAYDSGDKEFTLATALPAVPNDGDAFILLGRG